MTAATAPVVTRPDVTFDAASHTYTVEGRPVLGVSTVAKVGGVEDAFGIASAWGFRVGYEGAFDVAQTGPIPESKDALRAELQARGLTPWSVRDKAADRGSWVHDALEELAMDGAVPDLDAFAARHGEEAAGHCRSVLRWFLHFRPSFVATEVQVASKTHGFAGRYDIRARIPARLLLETLDPLRDDPQAVRIRELAERGEDALGLLDLKTSKAIYPTTHYPQLEGYEGAGVEMGFAPTDFRAVINTWPTGDHDPARDFQVSWSTYEDFLGYLGALRAIRRIKHADPERVRERVRADIILAQLPAKSAEIAARKLPELDGMDSRAIGRALGTLRKRGKATQTKGVWSRS